MSKKLAIRTYENGPIKIENASAVRYCGALKEIEPGQPVFICRCGDSKNLPYCDGTHHNNGFRSACERKETKENRIWEGKRLRTTFDPNLCMHVFSCKSLKELRAKETADSGQETAQEIMRVVRSCPSGALQYEIIDETLQDDVGFSEATDIVEIIEGGELRIRGDVETTFEIKPAQTRLTLCRCGLSKNKPFCDGRHKGRKDFK